MEETKFETYMFWMMGRIALKKTLSPGKRERLLEKLEQWVEEGYARGLV